MSSFNLFGGDESITLIEFANEDGQYNDFATVKTALIQLIKTQLQEYSAPVFVKDLRYVRLWKLLQHVQQCNQPADYQWHVLYEQFMNPDVNFPLQND